MRPAALRPAARRRATLRQTALPTALRSALAACIGLLVFGGPATTASAQTTARLHAAFAPYRLGSRTTLQFEFAFSAPPGQDPPPLVEMQLRYPRGLNFFLNNLGTRRCSLQTLEAGDPTACPRDSVMGYGVVQTGIVLGETPVEESSPITVLRAPESDDHLALLFDAEGTQPVVANVIFSGILLSAREPFGGRVQIGVPLVETLPGAPYVSVLHLHATIGPRNLTYYHNVAGVSLAFKPQGILLPPTCPLHSFPFAANFTFSDGTHAQAKTTVRCPPSYARRRARGARGLRTPRRWATARPRRPRADRPRAARR